MFLKKRGGIFVCRRDFCKKSFWKKGNVQLFSFPKRKKLQKRSWQAGRLTDWQVWQMRTTKPARSARTPARAQNCSLDERNFAARRFFVDIRCVWKLFFWCANGILAPPRAYFIPTECGERAAIHFHQSHWGLNRTVGISTVLWRRRLHPI